MTALIALILLLVLLLVVSASATVRVRVVATTTTTTSAAGVCELTGGLDARAVRVDAHGYLASVELVVVHDVDGAIGVVRRAELDGAAAGRAAVALLEHLAEEDVAAHPLPEQVLELRPLGLIGYVVHVDGAIPAILVRRLLASAAATTAVVRAAATIARMIAVATRHWRARRTATAAAASVASTVFVRTRSGTICRAIVAGVASVVVASGGVVTITVGTSAAVAVLVIVRGRQTFMLFGLKLVV